MSELPNVGPVIMAEEGSTEVVVEKATGLLWEKQSDRVAIEEPLEIRLEYAVDGKRVARSISITMRTPGDDESLAVGFLLSEGILHAPCDVQQVRACGPAAGPAQKRNVVRVELREGVIVDLKRLIRHFYTTSSCGVCGKTSLDALEMGNVAPLAKDRPQITATVIYQLPQQVRRAQAVFDRTGGLHAAALFNAAGNVLALREDVGRHNAVDKLIGAEFLAGRVPLADRGILVSGRASFELLQKALLAGIPMLAAVGAPSSLAVELAIRFGMTLIGFLRDGRFNVYSGQSRLQR
jgi:FdhD protein